MALIPRKAEIALFGGLQQDISEDVLEPPNMLVQENVRFDKEGRVRRRWGYTGVNPATTIGGNLDRAVRLATRDDKEVVVFGGTYIHSRTGDVAAVTDKWKRMDRVPSVVGLERRMVSPAYGINATYNATAAYSSSGYILVAHEIDVGVGGLHSVDVVVIDQKTRQIVSSAVFTNAVAPRCIALGNDLIVVYNTPSTTNLVARRMDLATFSAWGAGTNIVTTNFGGSEYDIAPGLGEQAFYVASIRNGGGGQLDVFRVNSTSLAVTSSLDVRGAAKACSRPACLVKDGIMYVAFYNSTDTTVECLGRNAPGLTSAFVAQLIRGASASIPVNVVVGPRNVGAWVAYDIDQTSVTSVQRTEWRGISTAGSVDANGPWVLQNMRMTSKPFILDDLRTYMSMSARADQNNQYGNVLVDIGNDQNAWVTTAADPGTYRGRPVAKWMTAELMTTSVGTLSMGSTGPLVSNEVGVSTHIEVYIAYGKKDATVLGFGRGGGAELTILRDFNFERWSGTCQPGRELYIPAALPYAYDGEIAFEAGFSYHPWAETIGTAGAGTLDVGSTYEYRFCFEKVDRQGRVWRSKPSAMVSQATVAGQTRIQVRVPHYSLTAMVDHEHQRGGVTIVGYRRKAGDPNFIRLQKTGNIFDFSDPAATSYLLFDDTGASYNTLNQPPLYASAATSQENDPPRPSSYSCIYDGRVFQVLTDEPRKVQFSHEFLGVVDPEGVRFNELNLIQTPDDGDLVAIQTLDSYLYMFKRRAIYWMQGQGPTDDGLNGAYTPPARLAVDRGCINANSLALTPSGIFFQSERGLELLTRSQQVESKLAVEDLLNNNLAITSAVVHTQDSEVRWTCIKTSPDISLPDGGIIKYNYEFDRWSFDPLFRDIGEGTTYLAPSCAAYINGQYWLGDLVGVVAFEERSETLNSYRDKRWLAPEDEIPYIIHSANIKLDGLQGFQRVWRVTLLGRKLYENIVDSPGVNVGLAIDGDNNNSIYVFSPTEIADQANAPIIRLRIIPKIQRGSWMKVAVAETLPPGTSTDQHNAGIAWTSVMLEYGVEPKPLGRFKGTANK